MHKVYLITTYLLLSAASVFSQKTLADSIKPRSASTTNSAATTDTATVTKTTRFNPIFGLGLGVFTFYGDINSKHLTQLNTSRLSYNFSVSQNITDFLNLRFFVLFGKMGMADLNPYRHLNFETQIRMGGVHLSYNFHHLLSPKRGLEPYLSLGVESFEYLSKTDLKDANGNLYNYWSDGSIRDIAENAPNAASAIRIKRDYTYESDIRELNLDGFGKYREQALAYSLGGGGTWLLHKQLQLRIGMSMHFSTTDLVDGITTKGEGIRQGDARNDRFLHTSFSINYQFKEKDKKESKRIEELNKVDFFALETADNDGDGVIDFKDSCQYTPKGVPIDEKGCPYNADKDIVLDYKDMELTSLPFAVVDSEGVTVSDAAIDLWYRQFKDSTGEFNEKVQFVTAVPGARKINSNVYIVPYTADFTIQLAKYSTGVPPEQMDKLLNILDIRSIQVDNTTTLYTAGKFQQVSDAVKRLNELKSNFPEAKIIYKQNKKFVDYEGPAGNSIANTVKESTLPDNKTTTTTSNVLSPGKQETATTVPDKKRTVTKSKQKNKATTVENTVIATNENVVFWVQLGAYRRKITRDLFARIPSVVTVRTEENLFKYLTGSCRTFAEAAVTRINMLALGYEDAFIIAYKDGKRVPLHTVGATAINKKDIDNLQGPEVIIENENDSIPENK